MTIKTKYEIARVVLLFVGVFACIMSGAGAWAALIIACSWGAGCIDGVLGYDAVVEQRSK